MRVLGDIREVKTQSLAKTSEFDLALMFQAELEGLLCNLLYHRKSINKRISILLRNVYLIDSLQPRVVFQRFECGTIALPEELEPGRHKRSICAILILITANGAEEYTLRRLARLEVVDIHQRDGLLSLFLRLLDFRVREGDKSLYDRLDRRNARILRDILILHQSFLGCAALAHVDAELDEAQHDRFERRKRRRAESF